MYPCWYIHELDQLGQDEDMSEAPKVVWADNAGRRSCIRIETRSLEFGL